MVSAAQPLLKKQVVVSQSTGKATPQQYHVAPQEKHRLRRPMKDPVEHAFGYKRVLFTCNC